MVSFKRCHPLCLIFFWDFSLGPKVLYRRASFFDIPGSPPQRYHHRQKYGRWDTLRGVSPDNATPGWVFLIFSRMNFLDKPRLASLKFSTFYVPENSLGHSCKLESEATGFIYQVWCALWNLLSQIRWTGKCHTTFKICQQTRGAEWSVHMKGVHRFLLRVVRVQKQSPGFPPIREIREFRGKSGNLFQSGKSGKNRGYSASTKGKKQHQGNIFKSGKNREFSASIREKFQFSLMCCVVLSSLVTCLCHPRCPWMSKLTWKEKICKFSSHIYLPQRQSSWVTMLSSSLSSLSLFSSWTALDWGMLVFSYSSITQTFWNWAYCSHAR